MQDKVVWLTLLDDVVCKTRYVSLYIYIYMYLTSMWCLCFYIFMWWTLSLNMGFVIAFFLYLNCTVEQSDAISTWIVGWSVGIWFLIGYLSLKLTNRLSVAIDFQCNRLSVAKCNVWRYRVLPAGLTPAAEVCRYKYLASDRLSLYLPLPSDHPSLILVLWCSDTSNTFTLNKKKLWKYLDLFFTW